MNARKEWRAVGIDVEDGVESREERNWRTAKAAAREDAAYLRADGIPYDRVIVERRKVTEPIEVTA